jgi:hypothetical protein
MAAWQAEMAIGISISGVSKAIALECLAASWHQRSRAEADTARRQLMAAQLIGWQWHRRNEEAAENVAI